MATGIVSKAMRLDSSATLSAALLSAGIAPGHIPARQCQPCDVGKLNAPSAPGPPRPGSQ